MNDDRLSRGARGLLDAARSDGPSAGARSRIWEGVSLAPQLSLVASHPVSGGAGSGGANAARSSLHPGSAAAVTKAVGASAVAAITAGKLLLAGAVVGSALTVGLGVFALRAPTRPHVAYVTERAADDIVTYGAVTVDVPSLVPASEQVLVVDGKGEKPPPVTTGSGSTSVVRGQPLVHQDDGEALMLEAARVSEARKALAAGHAAAALVSLDAAARATSRSLEPEELSLRVRALRQLGREVDAMGVEDTLRARYPRSFLAR